MNDCPYRVPQQSRKLLISCAIARDRGRRADAAKGARRRVQRRLHATPERHTVRDAGIGTRSPSTAPPPPSTGPRRGEHDFLPFGNTATFTSSSGVDGLHRSQPDHPRSRPADPAQRPCRSRRSAGSATGRQRLVLQPGRDPRRRERGVRRRRAAADLADANLTDQRRERLPAPASPGRPATAARSHFSGATINALQQNSYVALVAPRIVQDGDVQVDGSAAYVAAEYADHDDGPGPVRHPGRSPAPTTTNGIVHTGTTTGTAQDGNHRIYMIAVPRTRR